MKRFAVLLLTLAMAFCCAAPAFAAGTIEVTEDVSVSDDYDWTRFQGQNLTLNVYNWGEYISNGSDDSVDVVAAFEKLTGIKVNYQTFENNEGLHAKLVAGNTGFDIVVPGAVFAKSQIDGGLLMKLDKSKIPNLGNLDPAIMGKLASVDAGNDYLVPWAWSYTTAAINKAQVAKALGSLPMPENA